MTKGYLLDTNIVSYWVDKKSSQKEHRFVKARIDSLPDLTLLRMSAVVIGELDTWRRLAPKDMRATQKELTDFIETRLPHILTITYETALVYGNLKARLFHHFAQKREQEKLVSEQLHSPMPPKKLGADQNDLWLAAQALEHNLVLVTHDPMTHIQTIAPSNLDLEDWAAEAAAQ